MPCIHQEFSSKNFKVAHEKYEWKWVSLTDDRVTTCQEMCSTSELVSESSVGTSIAHFEEVICVLPK